MPMYTNTSLTQTVGRFKKGGKTEVSSNGSIEWWERISFKSDSSDIRYIVPAEYTQRIDSIATLFYGDYRLAWFICQYNNVIDPLSEIVHGRILWLPTKERMESMLSSSAPTQETKRVEKN